MVWAQASASASCHPMVTTSPTSSCPSRSDRPLNESPLRYGITRNGRPSTSPPSKIGTIWGCTSFPPTPISLWKRSRMIRDATPSAKPLRRPDRPSCDRLRGTRLPFRPWPAIARRHSDPQDPGGCDRSTSSRWMRPCRCHGRRIQFHPQAVVQLGWSSWEREPPRRSSRRGGADLGTDWMIEATTSLRLQASRLSHGHTKFRPTMFEGAG